MLLVLVLGLIVFDARVSERSGSIALQLSAAWLRLFSFDYFICAVVIVSGS
jgi:hypothetical protein